MLLSMTGFGKAIVQYGFKTFHIEIKAVNGRHLDLRFKLPNTYKNRELELRSLILSHAVRGKIDFSLLVDSEEGDEEYALNEQLFKMYYRQLDKLKAELQSEADLFGAILRLPNVVKLNDTEVEEEEWQSVKEAAMEALESLKKYRLNEGDALYKDLRLRALNILTLLDEVEPYEEERLNTVKQRIDGNLKDFIQEQIDQNRFEQEVIYYLEKFDITEEKVRLRQHCTFFMDILDTNEEVKGKKLNFINQEMGREINTLGAKANHSMIQRIVVQMKDQLEKIKEQIANVV